MSKYIRTKDGIYKDLTVGYCGMIHFCNNGIRVSEEEIIKQSDTIEELCDEAVAIYPDGSHDNCSVMHIVNNNDFCKTVYGCLSVSVDDLKKDYECWEVYGAIWTKWGLKYVAKMNKEGVLELI